MYLKPEEIFSLSLEITSHCNAACPMCSRYNEDWDTREPNKQLPILHVDYDVFIEFFEQLPNLNHCVFTGKYGDPLMNGDLNKYIDYLTNRGVKCQVHTNGSLRSEKWWQEIALYMNRTEGSRIVFSIDGLADTNHIYRQKTDFDQIIRNARAFIDTGGKATWDYLVFKHNQHQVDDAIDLAKNMGFQEINVKSTHRFKNRGDFNFIDTNGNPGVLSPPTLEKYKNGQEQFYLDGEIPPEKLDIYCNWQAKGKMMLGMTYKLWPCCFISEHFPELPGFNTMDQIWSRHGKDFNDIRKYTLEEILNHDFFANELETAWATGKNITKECWKKCTRGKSSQTEVNSIEFNTEMDT